eukprot:gnl/Dysnectes_brevis/7311_a12144_280.p1 GENE.gnl/Dysnectes_brevis/7311_a12144_280~~gnl/Dysnectes_brevis/7311_a12144_280.p1  ORF type:complete len:216 (-),score=74.93 gnl/Dysnectes_brevis/7311_a12144_280:232-879(-)
MQTASGQGMTLEIVSKKLAIPSDKIEACFVVGSRLFGLAQYHSDWDLILVVNDTAIAPRDTRRQVHRDNIDALLLHHELYRSHVLQHRLVELQTLWLPEQAVWRDNVRSTLPRFRLRAPALLAEAQRLRKRDLAFTAKLWAKDSARALKVGAHLLRDLSLLRQVAKHERVRTFAAPDALPVEQASDCSQLQGILEKAARKAERRVQKACDKYGRT